MKPVVGTTRAACGHWHPEADAKASDAWKRRAAGWGVIEVHRVKVAAAPAGGKYMAENAASASSSNGFRHEVEVGWNGAAVGFNGGDCVADIGSAVVGVWTLKVPAGPCDER